MLLLGCVYRDERNSRNHLLLGGSSYPGRGPYPVSCLNVSSAPDCLLAAVCKPGGTGLFKLTDYVDSRVQREPVPQPDLSTVRPLRVLIVEDNADDALVLHEAISQVGLRCVIHLAENAVQVFRHMRDTDPDQAPDLAIVDLNLPVITGTAVVREIREHPPWEKTRVVVLSGAAPEQEFRLCTAFGAQECLPKPGSFAGYLALARRLCTLVADAVAQSDSSRTPTPLPTPSAAVAASPATFSTSLCAPAVGAPTQARSTAPAAAPSARTARSGPLPGIR